MADAAARSRIVALEQEVARLRAEIDALRRAVTWTPVDDAPGKEAAPAGPTGPGTDAAGPAGHPSAAGTGYLDAPGPMTPTSDPAPAMLSGLAPMAPMAPAAAAPAPHGIARQGLESRIGTRWLAVAGISVFVVAAVLFLRLAFQNGWIGPAGQVALIASLGVLVWSLGAYLQAAARLGAFPQVLAAGGVAITAFAAYATHGVDRYREALGTSLEEASLLLGAVAALALMDAVVRSTEVQALVATALVPLTAVFADAWTAFSLAYTVVMTVALLAAAAWRRWDAVAPLAALAAYGIIAWHAIDLPWRATAAALLVLAAYVAVAVRARRGAAELAGALAIAWLGTWVVGMLAVARSEEAWWTAGLGAVALGLSFVATARVARITLRAVGLTGLIGAVALLPWPAALAWVWLLELAVAGAYRAWRPGRAADAVVAVLSGLVAFRLLMREAEIIDARGDAWALLAWLVAIALFAMLHALRRRTPLGHVHLGLAVAGTLALMGLLLDGPAITLSWAAVAAALVVAGFAMRRAELRIAGLAAFALVLLRVVTIDLAGVDAAWRVLAFAGVGLALLGTSWLYVRWAR